MFGVDDFVAEARAVGDEDFEFLLALFLFLVEHGVIRVETCLALRLTRFRCHPYPFELSFEGFPAF